MNETDLLAQLEELARKLSVAVRYEHIESEEAFTPGGICRIMDANVIIIDSRLSRQEKVYTLARSLKQFDLNKIYLRPALREFLKDPES